MKKFLIALGIVAYIFISCNDLTGNDDTATHLDECPVEECRLEENPEE